MTNKRLANGNGSVEQGQDKDKVGFKSKLKPGDTTWVKVRGFPWWPAQVVSENSVSRECKPRKRTKTAILVRLYGSYEYVFMDPVKTLPEIDKVLKRHKGSHSSIIKKALSQVVPEVVSCSSKMHKKISRGKRERHPQGNEEPEEDSAPKKAKTDSTPKKAKTDSAPKKAKTDSAPKKAKTDSAHKKANTDSAPKKAKTDSAPKKAKTDSAPKKAKTDSAPEKEKTDSTPKKEKTDSAPEKEPEEDSAPKKAKTDSTPKKAKTDSAPKKAKTDSAPKKAKTDSAPKKAKTDSAPKKEKTDSTPKKEKTDSAPKKEKTDSAPKKAKTDNDKPVIKTPKHSARRLKVMQVLGLTAPNGSPFHRNGHASPVAKQEDS